METGVRHHVGILGGSGLYELEGLTDIDEKRVFTPFGEPSDLITVGRLGATRLYFLPRHGRGHRIPPHRVNARANLYALKALGAEQIVSVSAVGSLTEDKRPGDFVVVDQYIDRTQTRPNTFFEDDDLVAHVSLADPVDAALSGCLAEAAERAGARVHRGGTYVCIEGPQFSTRAESQLYRSWRADVIGMTNLPEARLAREAELPYASLCMVTDYDCWHDTHEAVSVAHVIAVLSANVKLAKATLAAVQQWPDPKTSPATRALEHALITNRTAIPLATREKLGLLISKYLDGAALVL